MCKVLVFGKYIVPMGKVATRLVILSICCFLFKASHGTDLLSLRLGQHLVAVGSRATQEEHQHQQQQIVPNKVRKHVPMVVAVVAPARATVFVAPVQAHLMVFSLLSLPLIALRL